MIEHLVNQQLREHVTTRAFSLSLSKTQIEALVWLDAVLSWERVNDASRPFGRDHRGPTLYVTAIQACERRGLTTHRLRPDLDPRPSEDRRFGDYYAITRAGFLVVELLREAGLYHEVRAEVFPPVEAVAS